MKSKGPFYTKSYQIHITGIVQGVGFRPFIYKLAHKRSLWGWVCNSASGVYIRFNSDEDSAHSFLQEIIENAPTKSMIISTSLQEVASEIFSSFRIVDSFEGADDERRITPDYAICDACAQELFDPDNRRYKYAFITCSECGPRYSIIDKIPYDRAFTSMQDFTMCDTCAKEYSDPSDRRFYSQTNSCPTCGVKLSLYDCDKGFMKLDQVEIIDHAVNALKNGSIICVKGIGGYMLMADARNSASIQKLRERKIRPEKPFAIMVQNIEMAMSLAHFTSYEKECFLSDIAPIMLLKKKESTLIAFDAIAPQLREIGIMRAYTPLHQLILKQVQFPLIASSGNISASPIIYADEEIIEGMKNIADLILLHDRKINAPQDDSVLRCTKDDSPIYIRRSRGIAPNVFRDIEDDPHAIVAFGAMLKSTIGLLYKGNTFISQYIGNSNSYETQSSFIATYEHLQKVLDFKAEHIIADKHPGYFTHELAEELSMKHKIALHLVQHHEAHFSAVLGEYNLWSEKVLGIIWDGTGLGNDGNIWGGEIFSYQDAHIERIAHLDYQKHILGDKMVNEPRIAAFSFFNEIKGAESFLRAKFNEQEWSTYQNIHQRSDLFTSSMGRLFDAVASFLEIKDITTFHGQAAMLLEAKASEYPDPYLFKAYPDLVKNEVFQLKDLLENIVKDKLTDVDVKETALRFHHSLVLYIECIAQNQNTKIIAFSGGVFQNKLLVELITQKLAKKYRLFFNHQFSPNDESISFGQIMHYLHIRSNTPAI